MGLKSGSRNSGIDESEQDSGDGKLTDETPERESSKRAEQTTSGSEKRTRPEPNRRDDPSVSNDPETVGGESDSDGQLSVDSLPYKLRRKNVNEGREQVPYFLRPEVTEEEETLKRTLEDELGETVYKSDYREAAMVVAQRNPELIAEVLREWGYDLSE